MVGKKVQQKKGEANFSCAWLGTLERTQLQVMIIFISEDIIRGPVSKESNLGCVWAEHTMSSRCKKQQTRYRDGQTGMSCGRHIERASLREGLSWRTGSGLGTAPGEAVQRLEPGQGERRGASDTENMP